MHFFVENNYDSTSNLFFVQICKLFELIFHYNVQVQVHVLNLLD